MPVGILRAELLIPQARSLKEKRSPINSLRDRLRSRLGASVAEVDHQELHGRAALEIAIAARDGETLARMMDKAVEYLRTAKNAQLLDLVREVAEPAPGADDAEGWQ